MCCIIRIQAEISLQTYTGPDLVPTISQDFVSMCCFKFNNKVVQLEIWDTAGNERNFDVIPLRCVAVCIMTISVHNHSYTTSTAFFKEWMVS